MAIQTVFKRYEIKYMLTKYQRELLIKRMQNYMRPDLYGRTTICNLYYDTDNYRLIRHSLEKPIYKEKLRVRSYGSAEVNKPVFVELKKKYRDVVYKRRIVMHEEAAERWLMLGEMPNEKSQIKEEVEYFRRYYRTLHPVIYLSYEREAFYAPDTSALRLTLDEHILARREELSLQAEVWGEKLMEEGRVLMEIKTSGGIPLWLTNFLTEQRIFKTSFSKYGTAYQKMIYGENKGAKGHA